MVEATLMPGCRRFFQGCCNDAGGTVLEEAISSDDPREFFTVFENIGTEYGHPQSQCRGSAHQSASGNHGFESQGLAADQKVKLYDSGKGLNIHGGRQIHAADFNRRVRAFPVKTPCKGVDPVARRSTGLRALANLAMVCVIGVDGPIRDKPAYEVAFLIDGSAPDEMYQRDRPLALTPAREHWTLIRTRAAPATGGAVTLTPGNTVTQQVEPKHRAMHSMTGEARPYPFVPRLFREASMVRMIAILLFWLLPVAAVAQAPWRHGSYDNGDFFLGTATLSDLSVALSCGERSPLRPAWRGPQDMHALVTPAGQLQLRFVKALLGAPTDPLSDETRDVILTAAGAGYQLPPVGFDYHADAWVVRLGAEDPVFAAMAASERIDLQGAAGVFSFPGAGFAPAYAQLMAFCQAKFAAIGVGWPIANAAGQPAPADPAADALWPHVSAHLVETCGGAVASLNEGYALRANLDGDGAADFVIAWDAITCAGSIPRPYCGASQCAVDVFVSSAFRPGTRPETIYAAAVSVGPGPGGRDVLRLAGRLANCRAPGAPPDCIFHWAWRNGTLERIR
jgi:hypothetical protein